MKKWIAITVTVLLLLTGCAVTDNGSEEHVPRSLAFYFKDAHMWAADIDSGETWQITRHTKPENGGTRSIVLSENGERLVYAERADDSENAKYQLYTIRTDALGQEPQQITDDLTITFFDVSADGSSVLYSQKNADTGRADLYRFDMKESTLIAQGICDFGFSSKDNLPFYAMNKADPQYVLVDGDGSTMTKSVFEEQHGELHVSPYQYDGSFYTMSGGVMADGTYIDVDYDEPQYGGAKTFGDRAIYFKGTARTDDDRPYVLKLHIKGEEQPKVIHEDLCVPNVSFCGTIFASGGEVVYLEMDAESGVGAMMVYENGKARLLEEDVIELVDITFLESSMRSLINYHSAFR